MEALDALGLGASHPRGLAFIRVWLPVFFDMELTSEPSAPTALLRAMVVPKYSRSGNCSIELRWAALGPFGGGWDPI